MNISDETLTTWAKGPGKTEADKCENAETAVRKALAADDKLNLLHTTVFPQGSYRARTNVPGESDVDICIRYNGAFFADYPEGKSGADYKHIDSSLTYPEFKNLVQTALENYFGESSVTRGDKAFDVRENSYRIDADVVATFEHRRYTDEINFHSGVAFKPDSGGLIKNWPQQNYDNGVQKNDACSRYYKRLVRILKRLCYQMQDDGLSEAENIGSFLIECLVWNAPNNAFSNASYTADLRAVLAHTFNGTIKDADCNEWGEVNELKYLFRVSQPWTRERAHKFLGAAWNYMGYK